MLHPLKQPDAAIMQDTDLAGPLVFCLAFGGCLLLVSAILDHFLSLLITDCCSFVVIVWSVNLNFFKYNPVILTGCFMWHIRCSLQ